MNFFMAFPSAGVDELGENLRGLQHQRDGERREEHDSGGERGDLGHGVFL
mgnify:CR=1 FL=1